MNQLLPKIKDFCVKNEQKIVLVVGFCLISAISYEFGVLQGQKWQQKPLIIEKPSVTPEEGQSRQNEAPGTPANVAAATLTASAPTKTGCAFVGSKSSNKFYLPTCSYAKRVKPENLVCFKSAQEAIGQGRTESKCGK